MGYEDQGTAYDPAATGHERVCMKSRWDVTWGMTRREQADAYIAKGEAKRRKDGKWDMRYKASRHVHDVETGKPSIFE